MREHRYGGTKDVFSARKKKGRHRQRGNRTGWDRIWMCVATLEGDDEARGFGSLRTTFTIAENLVSPVIVAPIVVSGPVVKS
jgi:hypothetical protein